MAHHDPLCRCDLLIPHVDQVVQRLEAVLGREACVLLCGDKGHRGADHDGLDELICRHLA